MQGHLSELSFRGMGAKRGSLRERERVHVIDGGLIGGEHKKQNKGSVSAAAEEMLLIALINSVVREERFQEAVWLTAIAVSSATCLQHGATFALRDTAKRGTAE